MKQEKTEIEHIREAVLLYCENAPELLEKLWHYIPEARPQQYRIVGLKKHRVHKDQWWIDTKTFSRKHLPKARAFAEQFIKESVCLRVRILRVFDDQIVEEYRKLNERDPWVVIPGWQAHAEYVASWHRPQPDNEEAVDGQE